MDYQITSLISVYWTVYSDTDQRKHPNSAPLACVRGIHRWPVNFPHEGPVTQQMFPFDDIIMEYCKPKSTKATYRSGYIQRMRWSSTAQQPEKWEKVNESSETQPCFKSVHCKYGPRLVFTIRFTPPLNQQHRQGDGIAIAISYCDMLSARQAANLCPISKPIIPLLSIVDVAGMC